jgi:cytidylate kinase
MTVVAIDGPAGAGKSTVARAVARRLGFTYLDSGAMYRAVALAAVRRGVAAADVASIVDVQLEGDTVMLDGEEVTSLIRTPEVSEAASVAAADPSVRAAMVEVQRALLADGGDWVAEGRDIATVVWPGAEVKVFLTASAPERARRRAAERGVEVAEVLDELAARDARDTGREASPLRVAPGAVELDTTGLTLEQVVDRIVALVAAPRA